MKKYIISSIIGVAALTSVLAFSSTNEGTTCKNGSCEACPCTPDCQPGDAWCTCPSDCKH